MQFVLRFICGCVLVICAGQASAQTIRGEVVDKDAHQPMKGVSITNIYTSLDVTTGDNGAFNIAATKDQLLEFSKPGYKPARVRIPKGYVPSYFRILLERGFVKPEELLASNNRYDYRADSLRYRELYKHELDFEKLSAVGSISHPFSALSKKNREIWRFQADYDAFEKDKYIDRTFNSSLVTKITGLQGDSLTHYMVRYRPDYDELRNMSDYTFFNYIKRTVHSYRNPNTPRNSQ